MRIGVPKQKEHYGLSGLTQLLDAAQRTGLLLPFHAFAHYGLLLETLFPASLIMVTSICP